MGELIWTDHQPANRAREQRFGGVLPRQITGFVTRDAPVSTIPPRCLLNRRHQRSRTGAKVSAATRANALLPPPAIRPHVPAPPSPESYSCSSLCRRISLPFRTYLPARHAEHQPRRCWASVFAICDGETAICSPDLLLARVLAPEPPFLDNSVRKTHRTATLPPLPLSCAIDRPTSFTDEWGRSRSRPSLSLSMNSEQTRPLRGRARNQSGARSGTREKPTPSR